MDTAAGPTFRGDLMDHAPCGCLLLDADSRILAVSATLAGWLGRSAPDLAGRPAAEMFSIAGRVLLETNLLPLLWLRGRVEEVTLDLSASDGSRIPVLLSADLAGGIDGPGRVIRIVMLKAAARRSFERELIEARAEAERGLRLEKRQGELREQFVAVLGHDLRNPVASIAAAARLLEREPISPQGHEVLRLMKGSVQRMSGLIDNVLDFARNRLGGGIGLDLSNGEMLAAVIHQVIEELRAATPDRALRDVVAITHPVRCDVGRIGQLVSNLLGNALTHGDSDHPVTVHAATSAGGGLEVSVANRGAPIDDAVRDRLFDPFVRGGVGGHGKGLGLGLHIASEIARAHGGTLDVSSTPDETRFTFRMPPR